MWCVRLVFSCSEKSVVLFRRCSVPRTTTVKPGQVIISLISEDGVMDVVK